MSKGQEPIRYGDVFCVSGDLASKPVAPGDAKLMQSAETRVFGQNPEDGAAAAMQAAATYNERAGLVAHGDITDAAGDEGVTVAETDFPGLRIITESVGGQVVKQYVEPKPVQEDTGSVSVVQSAITIGQALERAARTAGDKPVDYSDAAAIQAAEVRAMGANVIVPGGLAATAQSAAAYNAATRRDKDKVRLEAVLRGATEKLPVDKEVTREDAESVVIAELKNNLRLTAHSGGVAASMTAAARLNEGVKD